MVMKKEEDWQMPLLLFLHAIKQKKKTALPSTRLFSKMNKNEWVLESHLLINGL